MADFMFLVQSDDTEQKSPEVMRARMENYRVWMTEKMKLGQVKAGQPLESRGVLVNRDKSVLTDGPFLEPKEIIAGYVIVSALDLHGATEIAQSCPLLDHCQLIVRPLVDVPVD